MEQRILQGEQSHEQIPGKVKGKCQGCKELTQSNRDRQQSSEPAEGEGREDVTAGHSMWLCHSRAGPPGRSQLEQRGQCLHIQGLQNRISPQREYILNLMLLQSTGGWWAPLFSPDFLSRTDPKQHFERFNLCQLPHGCHLSHQWGQTACLAALGDPWLWGSQTQHSMGQALLGTAAGHSWHQGGTPWLLGGKSAGLVSWVAIEDVTESVCSIILCWKQVGQWAWSQWKIFSANGPSVKTR